MACDSNRKTSNTSGSKIVISAVSSSALSISHAPVHIGEGGAGWSQEGLGGVRYLFKRGLGWGPEAWSDSLGLDCRLFYPRAALYSLAPTRD